MIVLGAVEPEFEPLHGYFTASRHNSVITKPIAPIDSSLQAVQSAGVGDTAVRPGTVSKTIVIAN